MVWQWVFSVVSGTVVWELTFGMFVWPATACPCRGRWQACWWCHGEGRHTRYARQALDAMVRKALGR